MFEPKDTVILLTRNESNNKRIVHLHWENGNAKVQSLVRNFKEPNQHSSDCKSVHLQHGRSRFWAPPMTASRYVEEISSAAMLATKMLSGVTAEVNLTEYVMHTPLPNLDKAAHSGFEIQRRHQQESKIGNECPPPKRTYVPNFF